MISIPWITYELERREQHWGTDHFSLSNLLEITAKQKGYRKQIMLPLSMGVCNEVWVIFPTISLSAVPDTCWSPEKTSLWNLWPLSSPCATDCLFQAFQSEKVLQVEGLSNRFSATHQNYFQCDCKDHSRDFEISYGQLDKVLWQCDKDKQRYQKTLCQNRLYFLELYILYKR